MLSQIFVATRNEVIPASGILYELHNYYNFCLYCVILFIFRLIGPFVTPAWGDQFCLLCVFLSAQLILIYFQGDIDVLEPGYGLSIEKSVSLLQRLLSLADIMVIASNVSLHDLEHEKSMTNGTMLRQCLRIGNILSGLSTNKKNLKPLTKNWKHFTASQNSILQWCKTWLDMCTVSQYSHIPCPFMKLAEWITVHEKCFGDVYGSQFYLKKRQYAKQNLTKR